MRGHKTDDEGEGLGLGLGQGEIGSGRIVPGLI